jgi:3,4-dihydroxy 2-butanone 4-phosphate synthase/3,4-dihydroxy 2-butanone 4-phosphate synthase/GTP cyclohydrolase II
VNQLKHTPGLHTPELHTPELRSDELQSGARTGLDRIDDAIRAMAAGLPVLVVDNEDRENEGDIIFAAQHATPALMGWTVRYSSGVICVPLDGDRADALLLPPMVAVNEDSKGTAYTVSCDAAVGVSTGISATDRAITARVLADPGSRPESITRPGHVFPLRAVNGGVRERPGHTEAAVDLCRLAGLEPVGVIAEVVYDNGEMMRLDGLRGFAAEHGCPLISIQDLVAYLEAAEQGGRATVPVQATVPAGNEEIR